MKGNLLPLLTVRNVSTFVCSTLVCSTNALEGQYKRMHWLRVPKSLIEPLHLHIKYANQFLRSRSQPFVEQRNCPKRKGSLSSFRLSVIEEVSDLLQTRGDNMVIRTKATLSTS